MSLQQSAGATLHQAFHEALSRPSYPDPVSIWVNCPLLCHHTHVLKVQSSGRGKGASQRNAGNADGALLALEKLSNGLSSPKHAGQRLGISGEAQRNLRASEELSVVLLGLA